MNRINRFVLFLAIAPLMPITAARAHSFAWSTRVHRDSSLAASFVGCYRLTVPQGNRYELRFTLSPVGQRFAIEAYGPNAGNSAGNQWSWSPVDTTRFRLWWNGIDSAMEFQVTRKRATLVATGTMYQANSRRFLRLRARIAKLSCPVPAA